MDYHAAHLRGRDWPLYWSEPKEQPPRKLSGKRTAEMSKLWKVGARQVVDVPHRRSNPRAIGRGKSLRFSDRGGDIEAWTSETSENLVAEKHSTPKNHAQQSALSELHQSLGAKMIPFGGFLMPLSYPLGILAEHNHCRSNASLFDVSHMAQFILRSTQEPHHIAECLENLVPGNIVDLKEGRLCYTMFTNAHGGIIDDLIIGRTPDHFLVVGNASSRRADMETLSLGLPDSISIEENNRGLIALQGPASADVLSCYNDCTNQLSFMEGTYTEIAGNQCWVSRSGYTGEDGFEIASTLDTIGDIARILYSHDQVEMAGLGARDILRLEAGLNLYGQDLDPNTTPIEAGLSWTINSRRRREGNFPGSKVILAQLSDRPEKRRIAVTLAAKLIARTGSPIKTQEGNECGFVTSGGFSPTTNKSIAMGYIRELNLPTGDPVKVEIRGQDVDAKEVKLPFVTHRYFREQET